VTDEITRRLKRRPEIASVFVNGGQLIGNGGKEIRKAAITVNLVHKTKRSLTQKQVEAAIGQDLADIPDIRYWFVQGNGQRGLSLIVAGNDNATVNLVAAQVQSQMKRIPILALPVSTASLDRPEIQIRPKVDLAADLGVSTDAISETIRLATIGDIGANLAKFDAGDRLIPIRVELVEEARTDLATLESLKVRTNSGANVPLSAVADIGFAQGPTNIDRYDRNRRVAVEADLVGDAPLGAALDRVYQLPIMQALPPGISIKQFGDAEIQTEVFQGFATAMGAGLMMVYGVLVLLFASVLQPITILFSLPLSIGGVILALYITNKAVSMPVVIGILMLIGIVTKNAIMLVDFAVEQMARGVPRTEAIVDAGRKRARPIVMTTIAMAAGMLPSALALGDGGEFRAPMAIGVIGGLLVSTVLSLVFVPAVFTIMDSVGGFIWWLFGRFVGPTDEPAAAAPGAPAGSLAAMAPLRPGIRQAAE
jgi:multidrug efflux pump subunit AcrB